MSTVSPSFGADGASVSSASSTHSASCFLRWRDEWAVGVDPIDTDYRMLCALLDRIAQEFCANHFGAAALAGDSASGDQPCLPEVGVPADKGGAKASLMLHLWVLEEHVRAHFAREEALMRASDYPDLAAHQREHRLMLAEYVDLLREISTDDGETLNLETLRSLKGWLLGHLLDTDRKLGDYLRGLKQVTRH
jgi:hemerythrin